MDTQLLDRILQDAQDRAPNASEADAIRCLAVDLEMIPEGEDLPETFALADRCARLEAHIATQPWDITTSEDDEDGYVRIAEITPGAFEAWLSDLENCE